MATIDLNRTSAGDFVRRLDAINTSDQRRWGTLDPAALMRHLNYVFEASLNEQRAEKVFIPLPRFVVWYLFFVWFTRWPEGKIKAPDSFCPDGDAVLEEERTRCVAALWRFVEALESAPERKGFSPLLGNISLRRWSRVHGVHLAHHLRQYGV